MEAHRRYPAFVLPSSLLNTISLQAPVVMLASNFSTAESGLYALGLAAVQMPLSLVESGVSSAFISRIREYESAGRLADVITRMAQALALVGAPLFALGAVWGPDLMAFVFGAEWREGGTYLALLTPWLFVKLDVFSACGMVLWARNRQGADFGWQILFVSLRLAALALGSRTGSAVMAVGGLRGRQLRGADGLQRVVASLHQGAPRRLPGLCIAGARRLLDPWVPRPIRAAADRRDQRSRRGPSSPPDASWVP